MSGNLPEAELFIFPLKSGGISRWFLQDNGIDSVNYYHGGMEQEQRMLIQQQFISGQLKIICATSAFGMGVNKSDVRYVIHYHIPSTMEAYLQEIGRAGETGNKVWLSYYIAKGMKGFPSFDGATVAYGFANRWCMFFP
ncbi:hypothetical protein KEH51_25865 [[Brevibacterium] frigoritolerans]|uniref:Helicase C-terminal domain-containing protein n=1 Tax=Peribacillus frigoritolerans TaxID=450367 RepID=A0A941JBT9_9BACI|nr:hypothetical protein [Peribacillus frigoritolerans]